MTRRYLSGLGTAVLLAVLGGAAAALLLAECGVTW